MLRMADEAKSRKRRRAAPHQKLTKNAAKTLAKAVTTSREQAETDSGALHVALFTCTMDSGIVWDRVTGCIKGQLPTHYMGILFFTLFALRLRLAQHSISDAAGVKQALIAMILSALNRGAPQTRAPRPARIRLRRVRPARPTGAGERPGYGKAHMKPTWWPSTVKWKASKTADSMVRAPAPRPCRPRCRRPSRRIC